MSVSTSLKFAYCFSSSSPGVTRQAGRCNPFCMPRSPRGLLLSLSLKGGGKGADKMASLKNSVRSSKNAFGLHLKLATTV